PVPTAAAIAAAPPWAQPALALFPKPNGPALGRGLAEWDGHDSRPGGLQAGNVRIDQALGPRVSIFGYYSDSPSYNEFGFTQVNHLNFRTWSGTLGMNFHPSPDTAVDVRLNRSDTAASSVWNGATGCELRPLAAVLLPAAPSCDALVR